MKNSETTDVEHVIMGVASYRILESLDYQQGLQYEPSRLKPSGQCERDNVILITTQEGEAPENVENEPNQMDATYLAINLAYVPDEKRANFTMDTSGGKSCFE